MSLRRRAGSQSSRRRCLQCQHGHTGHSRSPYRIGRNRTHVTALQRPSCKRTSSSAYVCACCPVTNPVRRVRAGTSSSQRQQWGPLLSLRADGSRLRRQALKPRTRLPVAGGAGQPVVIPARPAAWPRRAAGPARPGRPGRPARGSPASKLIRSPCGASGACASVCCCTSLSGGNLLSCSCLPPLWRPGAGSQPRAWPSWFCAETPRADLCAAQRGPGGIGVARLAGNAPASDTTRRAV